MIDDNWRAYHLCNFYLSSIQQGIQAAHAQTELFRKYCLNGWDPIVAEWSKSPTMICLNGGNLTQMRESSRVLIESSAFPFARFYEDEDSLNKMLTNIVVLLPERVWSAMSVDMSDTSERIRHSNIYGPLSGGDIRLAEHLSGFRLAS